jgi:hypothetical protein
VSRYWSEQILCPVWNSLIKITLTACQGWPRLNGGEGGNPQKMKTVSSAPSSSNTRIDSEHIRHTDLVRREIRSDHHSFSYICRTTPRMEGQLHLYRRFLALQDTQGENINRQRNRGTYKAWTALGTILASGLQGSFSFTGVLTLW